MKKIILSASCVVAVGAMIAGGTMAFFSDTETSTGNTFMAGTIDISVNDQNPWSESWSNYLDKPCQVNYMAFDIQNVGENPVNIWKRIMNVETEGGTGTYSCDPNIAGHVSNCAVVPVSSEPECEEGTANYTQCYVERDNLASYMIYDMTICKHPYAEKCPYKKNEQQVEDKELGPDLTGIYGTDHNWLVVIPEENEVRIDNINSIWVKLDGELKPGRILRVVQSYHLMAWNDAGEETVTNWAQGDIMTFDIELDARQLTAPAPGVTQLATLQLMEKNTTTWDPVQGGAVGALTYYTSKNTFDYDFSASLLNSDENYSLIYYPDPWGSQVTVLSAPMFASSGSINVPNQSIELNSDLPMSGDANLVGAKIWLVPSDKLGNSIQGSLTTLSWSETDKFLFEENLIQYEDTN